MWMGSSKVESRLMLATHKEVNLSILLQFLLGENVLIVRYNEPVP